MQLRTTWGLIKRTISNNPISFILILTVVIGYLSTSITWPEGSHIHWNGNTGFYINWHRWMQSNYLIGFLLLSIGYFTPSPTDKNVLTCYFIFDLLGYLSYEYLGHPEPKELFIWAFCLSLILFILLQIFRK